MSTSRSQASPGSPRTDRTQAATAPTTNPHPNRIQAQQQNGTQANLVTGNGPSWAGVVSKNLPPPSQSKQRQAPHPQTQIQEHKTPNTATRREQPPNSFHLPSTDQEEQHVYVLTLLTTPSIATPMNAMRKAYFPAHLNRTPAHLTLFHALPHSQVDTLQDSLTAIATHVKPFPISTGRPFRMGKGVGIGLDEGRTESVALHGALRAAWMGFLSEQDQGGWRPHWTVMNKVSDEGKVKDAFDAVRRELGENAYRGRVVGLEMWRYDRGRWAWVRDFKLVGDGGRDAGEALRL